MRNEQHVRQLLDQLDENVADDLEGQDLDFKRWPGNIKDTVKQVVSMAVCMANGNGGTVVFGVADRVKGREKAILGIPLDVDTNLLLRAVFDSTAPTITPRFEEMSVPEGTGRLLLMHINQGIPPYTDSAGHGTVRVGKECKPLTGTMRREMLEVSGDSDFTATTIHEPLDQLLSASAMERLRQLASMEKASTDFLESSDVDLLNALRLIQHGKLTAAGLLLVGNENAIRKHVPGAGWTWVVQRTDTTYDNREDGASAIPVAITRLEDLIRPLNPLDTFEQGFFHFEYRRWPELAIREALMNAFCHRDYRQPGPVVVRVQNERLSFENLGGFVGGVRPDNILHHSPATRNALLVSALVSLRLINRLNLGVKRMFTEFLAEGKPAPHISDVGNAVHVEFTGSGFSPAFRAFVADESQQGRALSLDELLTLNYLMDHAEAETVALAGLCQKDEASQRDSLATMEKRQYIERGGHGKGTYWTLHSGLRRRFEGGVVDEARQRIDWDAAKLQIMSMLTKRKAAGEPGLTNQEMRKVTHFDRYQVRRLMYQLKNEGLVKIIGAGRTARWVTV